MLNGGDLRGIYFSCVGAKCKGTSITKNITKIVNTQNF